MLRHPIALAVALTLTCWSSRAAAQGHEGVAESGMGQGHASISTRDEVSMGLESVPGTGAARLQALGRAVSVQLRVVRECYSTTARARPIVGGVIRLRLTLPETGAPTTAMESDEVHDAELVACIDRALRGISPEGIDRPAAARVVLTLANSASRTAEAGAAAAQQAEQVTVDRSSGSPVARGEAQSVTYEVRGAADASDELVSDAYHVLRSGVAALLDCRRRASRRGRDPSGTTDIALVLTPGRAIAVDVTRTTVADPMLTRCLETKLARVERRPTVRGRATVVVTYDR